MPRPNWLPMHLKVSFASVAHSAEVNVSHLAFIARCVKCNHCMHCCTSVHSFVQKNKQTQTPARAPSNPITCARPHPISLSPLCSTGPDSHAPMPSSWVNNHYAVAKQWNINNFIVVAIERDVIGFYKSFFGRRRRLLHLCEGPSLWFGWPPDSVLTVSWHSIR